MEKKIDWNKNAMDYESVEAASAAKLKDLDNFGKEAYYFRENNELKLELAMLKKDLDHLKYDNVQLNESYYKVLKQKDDLSKLNKILLRSNRKLLKKEEL